jgi:hypothetical protein
MKTKKISRHLASLALLIIGVTSRAEASVIIDITQSGSDVVATGSGSIDTSNTSALTFLMNIAVGSGIYSGYDGAGELGLGPTSFNTDIYTGSITGPALGSGALIYASSGAGDAFVLDPGDGAIGVPTGYTSGAALSDSATWSGTTLTDLGLTPGTYVYTWGSGANLDSVTVNVEAAPEPGSVFLLGIGGVALLLYCSRKRIVHN